MKTAISIPDDLFEQLETFRRRVRKSRSVVFSAALREYMSRHAPDAVTEAINRAVDTIGDTTDRFVAAAAERILKKTGW
jgi:metal-responsive CopG/Arc/MetJ family transcriptional regulator